jgi:MYXO-CTERM domain-containing protein
MTPDAFRLLVSRVLIIGVSTSAVLLAAGLVGSLIVGWNGSLGGAPGSAGASTDAGDASDAPSAMDARGAEDRVVTSPGCSCRAARTRAPRGLAWLPALLALLGVRARRARRRA